jgi:hypothetical protein
MRMHCILRPAATWRRYWDCSQILLLAYLSLIIPFRVCFNEHTKPTQAVFWVDAAVDLYFVVDVVFMFRTAFLDKDGEFIYKPPSRVAKNYLFSWFPTDLVSCLPLNYLSLVFVDADLVSSDQVIRSNKALRLFRLFRLLRLLRLARIKTMMQSLCAQSCQVRVSHKISRCLGMCTSDSSAVPFHAPTSTPSPVAMG